MSRNKSSYYIKDGQNLHYHTLLTNAMSPNVWDLRHPQAFSKEMINVDVDVIDDNPLPMSGGDQKRHQTR